MAAHVPLKAPAPAGAALPAGVTPAMRRAAEEFESVFLAEMLRGLTAGLTGDGPLGGGEDDPFAGMLRDEHARLISRSGGIGLADFVLREMLETRGA